MNTTTLKLSKPLARPTAKHNGPPRQFVIWRRGGTRPKVRHASVSAALEEVTRLRRQHPDERYDIFELVPLQRDTGLQRR